MPKETKHTPFVCYIEPTLYALVQIAIRQEDTPGSAYLRNLIINDLRSRGILTPSLMESILLGTGLEKTLGAVAIMATAATTDPPK